jgi:hypothetical protein
MAVDTTIDNAVIDYTAITSILQTVKSHDDLFVNFTNGSMGQLNDADDSANGNKTVAATNFFVAAASKTAVYKNGGISSLPISFGKSFGQPPIVTVTAYASGNSNAAPICYLSKPPSLDGVEVTVIDPLNKGNSSIQCTINVIAFGIKGTA